MKKEESTPTEWTDIFEGRAEATLPHRYDTLIAEFSGRIKWKGKEKS